MLRQFGRLNIYLKRWLLQRAVRDLETRLMKFV